MVFAKCLLTGEKAFDFNYTKFDENKHVSGSVRYFDGYFSWSAKMKNLFVKTDNNYTLEFVREESADYYGCQTTKIVDGKFDVRFLASIDPSAFLADESGVSTTFTGAGYEVIAFWQDKNGALQSGVKDVRADMVYEKIVVNGGEYRHEDGHFLHAVVISDVDATLPRIEFTVRPYVVGQDGIRRYGLANTLVYEREKSAEGYPIVDSVKKTDIDIYASEDTYIYKNTGTADTAYGLATELVVRNPGNETSNLYRASYFKFEIPKAQIAMLSDDASVTLKVYCKKVDKKDSKGEETRKPYGMQVFATSTEWTESGLTYNTRDTANIIGDRLKLLAPVEAGDFFEVDIRDYLLKCLAEQDSADGDSITVSFCFVNEGSSDAAAYILASSEDSSKPNQPSIKITSSSRFYNLEANLNKHGNDGYEPWGYAESLVDEWFDELVDKIYPKDESGNVIDYEIEDFAPTGYGATTATGDFSSILDWKNGTIWTESGGRLGASSFSSARYARTLSTLDNNGFLNSSYANTTTEYDEYGGIANAGFKGTEDIPFFHTEVIDGRYYIIDPIGNPYFAIGVNTVTLGDSDNHKDYSREKYGTEESYYEAITKELQGMGINTNYGGDFSQLLNVDDGLANVVSINMVGTYMTSLGRSQISEGQFPFNNTINVFDPDFVTSAYKNAGAKIEAGGYAEMDRLFGYTSDNELPSGTDVLERYLQLDPSEPGNSFSYAVAWTWLARRMNTPVPTLREFKASPERAQMNSEFLGFLYARVYRVSGEAIKAADPNHMYLGSRVHNICLTNEDYLRAAGYYLDIVTVNLYGGLNPDAETMTNFYRYSGKPFIVTEFFAKAMDAIDANGLRLANSTGAGILVKTQQDRADYYEHYALAMLECRGCVGWTWYRYRDNDQSYYTSNNYPDQKLVMAHVAYGVNAKANSFLLENGKIVTAAQVGTYREAYKGEPMMSNQNVNKGIFNSDFSSVVTVYTYDSAGNLTNMMSYEVQDPTSEKDTELQSLDGTKTYIIGEKTTNGQTIKTVLTVYKGRYIALSNSIRSVSDHLMGLVHYFDEN